MGQTPFVVSASRARKRNRLHHTFEGALSQPGLCRAAELLKRILALPARAQCGKLSPGLSEIRQQRQDRGLFPRPPDPSNALLPSPFLAEGCTPKLATKAVTLKLGEKHNLAGK